MGFRLGADAYFVESLEPFVLLSAPYDQVCRSCNIITEILKRISSSKVNTPFDVHMKCTS